MRRPVRHHAKAIRLLHSSIRGRLLREIPVRLSELLEELGMDVQALRDMDITGLTADSRAVKAGFLFAALPGSQADGRAFIGEAVKRGAAAVLAPPGTDLGTARQARDGNLVRLITDSNPRRRFALMAARFAAAQPETVVAVTGTNGKTSVAHFTQQLWTSLGFKAGYLGTLGAWGPGFHVDGSLTTPDPVRLHSLLAEMSRHGTTHLAMEASSHGLHQFRIDGVRIAVGAFTNLSRDHLDYHGSMTAYLNAKLRLFTDVMAPDGVAVLNADSSEFAAFDAACRQRGLRVIAYGRQGKAIRLDKADIDGDGQRLALTVFDKPYAVRLPLAGAFQTSNTLCALGCVLAGGSDPARSVAALAALTGVPGRLEQIGRHASGATIYVDYAHTPDALETVLTALRPHVSGSGRLIAVFGCGGDRDRGKRRIMGERAKSLADVVYVTDDNPRTESAVSIRAEVLQGCPDAIEIGDRGAAIAAAVGDLKTGDVLVIAGKGHETGQIVGDQVLPFNDAEVARAVLTRGSGT
ncbi:MAG: UDP-N-acetylmuramoyl-L-alanyl-D-glutamate--2,6-diaminopimelate ligase [Rhodospirillaceae bacterium]|nr:MAG: UDP-N-acetylmuramoyl-L-alanyl-D-glutamate--2,6-diaminopimelate ligase [Rhodospirillaceae bacterium]